MIKSDYDVVIVGAGIVGMTAAVALTRNSTLKVAVLDAQTISTPLPKQKYDHRVSAISLASRNIFQKMNVWEKITEKRLSSYVHMHVWDENSAAEIRFNAQEVGQRALGFIVEDHVMRASLLEVAQAGNQIEFICPVKLLELQEKSDAVEMITADGRVFSTKLIIAADGANSWVREQLGMGMQTWDYEHTAIVATVQIEKPHEHTAWQRFLKTGPLAFLPLNDAHHCSIVWSASSERAEELLNLDDDGFKESLAEAFDFRFGKILNVEKRHHFPLRMRHAKHYVQNRVALVGDAAHTIHPLAGQGVNLGLLDAACLVEVIVDAINKQRDFSNLATLRRYERWRKGDNVAMIGMIEALKQLFMSDKSSLQKARSLGFTLTNKIPFLKNFFVQYALGKRGDLPGLAR